jgi:hypothetical protein
MRCAKSQRESGGSVFFRNVGVYLQVRTAFQPRGPTLTFPLLKNHQVSWKICACVAGCRFVIVGTWDQLQDVHVGFVTDKMVFLCQSSFHQMPVIIRTPIVCSCRLT